MSNYQTKIMTSLSAISENDWNACCFNDHTGHNPFLSYQFMSALETAGCATPQTGWTAQHIIIMDDSLIIGIMPLYLKAHSHGEYVFDHAWANAYHHGGGHYYPKLQCSIPFTPVTGPRLMVHPAYNKKEIQDYLLNSAVSHAQNIGASSLHVTFAEKSEWQLMSDHHFLERLDQQYHWINKGYRSFEDFLAALSSRKRKNIRRERKQAVMDNIDIEILRGDDITEDHWDHYFSFYLDTANRKWGQPYLNRTFFSLLNKGLSDRIVLIMSKRHGQYIAGALNLLSDDTLFGRYWGAIEDHRYLHFEVCYYQAIDYAIRHGLKKIEAGAQGEHKLSRGYLPTSTYSAHWIGNLPFRKAVANFLIHEKEAVMQDKEILLSLSPFKQEPTPFKKDSPLKRG